MTSARRGFCLNECLAQFLREALAHHLFALLLESLCVLGVERKAAHTFVKQAEPCISCDNVVPSPKLRLSLFSWISSKHQSDGPLNSEPLRQQASVHFPGRKDLGEGQPKCDDPTPRMHASYPQPYPKKRPAVVVLLRTNSCR